MALIQAFLPQTLQEASCRVSLALCLLWPLPTGKPDWTTLEFSQQSQAMWAAGAGLAAALPLAFQQCQLHAARWGEAALWGAWEGPSTSGEGEEVELTWGRLRQEQNGPWGEKG